MARIAALMELPSTDLRRSQNARNDQGRHALPNGAVLAEQILGNGNTMHEEALKRIASLSPIRQSKVLDIRRHLAKGTYEVADRLDRAMDRLLEALTT
jgi:hypothetical protein